MRCSSALLTLLFAGACSAAGAAGGGTREARPWLEPSQVDERDKRVPLPPPAETYVTEARATGVAGGPDAVDVGRELAEALRQRGDVAEPDGALAATAGWFLREAVEGRQPSASDGDAVARRLGFVGSFQRAAAFSLEGPDAGIWRQTLADVPRNMPITRYGVYAAAGGRYVAVVLGDVEVTMAPFPRHLAPGQTLELRGETAGRFEYARLYLTGVDGNVTETRFKSRRIQASLKLSAAGVYRVEVMGDGATGPVVLANVPVYVGVPEPEPGPSARAGAAPVVVDMEARLLALLNRSRTDAGLAPLNADPELRSLALAHSEDMAGAHFFGHVSPTTGSAEDRIRKAGLGVLMMGENVAQADSVEAAHQSLMDSPGHRANMLNPKFTHVGIGVAPRANDREPLLATLVFGRRPRATAAPSQTAAIEAIAALRRAKGVSAVTVDPVLQAGADAGVQTLARDAAAAPGDAIAASGKAAAREASRRGVSRRAGCATLVEVVELDQLEDFPLFVQPELRRVGIAVTSRARGNVTLLMLVVLTEGGSCGDAVRK